MIEPRLTDQWYVDAKKLALKAIEKVKNKETEFVPKNWEKVYFEWMDHIEPWCISRQIWWGHTIPAWYGPDGYVFVAATEAEALDEAEKKYGKKVKLSPETDVLDTWFSSGLWPIITLDGFNESDIFKARYPTSLLITGFDIIFFWVARMMMLGLYWTGKIPFEKVYMHALVRDQKGQKMSKSKGNVIDPLYLIDQYGADALRYTLASMAAPGRDIKLGEDHVAASRNFTTKIWNATRYVLMSGAHYKSGFDSSSLTHPLSQWIVAELKVCEKKVSEALSEYRFHDAANEAYQFLWGTYCDWYLELTKPLLVDGDEKTKDETKETMGWVLGMLMHIMHPIMPYISEEIWEALQGKGLLISAEWPHIKSGSFDKAQEEINFIIKLVSAIRSLRTELGIGVTNSLNVGMGGLSEKARLILSQNNLMVSRLGRLKLLDQVPEAQSIEVVVEQENIMIDVAGSFDAVVEKKRLEKELLRVEGELKKVAAKLGNQQILDKAPQEIIDELHERNDQFSSEKKSYTQSLEKIEKFIG